MKEEVNTFGENPNHILDTKSIFNRIRVDDGLKFLI